MLGRDRATAYPLTGRIRGACRAESCPPPDLEGAVSTLLQGIQQDIRLRCSSSGCQGEFAHDFVILCRGGFFVNRSTCARPTLMFDTADLTHLKLVPSCPLRGVRQPATGIRVSYQAP